MGLDFSISTSGLFAAQKAIQVTQNNIANMNTQGYARQQVELSVNTSLSGYGVAASIGNGVNVDSISRLQDEFLIAQSRGENSQVGYYAEMRGTLSSVESLFSETSKGSMSDRLANFFNAWDDLSKFPEENSYRNSLVKASEGLATKFNDMNGTLREVSAKMDREIDIQMKQINELIQKVVNVNTQITKSALEQPNSLLDERDRYLDQLSSLVNIDVTPDLKNPLLANVKIGGITLVSGTESRPLETMYDSKNEEWLITAGNSLVSLSSGSLKATVEVRNEVIPAYIAKLDSLAATLINEVNAVHRTGFGLDDSTGNDFFVGSGMHNIQVNDLMKTNPEKLAASVSVGTPGNADISKAIASIQNTNLFGGGTLNPINFYNGFAIEMATTLKITADNEAVHTSMLVNVSAQRQQVQGVNMDEELSNLLRFEQYYAANSKVISTVNSLYDTLLNMI